MTSNLTTNLTAISGISVCGRNLAGVALHPREERRAAAIRVSGWQEPAGAGGGEAVRARGEVAVRRRVAQRVELAAEQAGHGVAGREGGFAGAAGAGRGDLDL